MKKILSVSVAIVYSCFGFSQSTNSRKRCSTIEHEAYLQSQNPNRKAELAAYETNIQQWISSNPDFQSRATITIPVVVHVIYKNATENISDAQILAQIKVLNDDYAYTNADGSATPAAFKPLAANTGIQFCMAKRDPQGNLTTGILRKSTTVSSFDPNDGDKVKFTSKGGDDAWDTKKYLNIWTCDLGPVTLGYGEFPTGSQTNTYGLVCHYNTFGLAGATLPPYNLGRTSTHEIGHCFNLNHIWGDEPACAKDDNVSDTPMQKSEHGGGKINYPETTQRCNSSDPSSMFMNYMDYSDDNQMNMFSKGQATRMNAVISTPPYNALATSNGCVAPNTGTGEISLLSNSLNIYPNPANKNVSIEFVLTDDNSGSISLYNAVGQAVFVENLDKMNAGNKKYSLDITSLPQGLYLTTIKIGDNTITRKISVIK